MSDSDMLLATRNPQSTIARIQRYRERLAFLAAAYGDIEKDFPKHKGISSIIAEWRNAKKSCKL